MGIYPQYETNASTSDLSDDFIWTNPNELDLLEMKNTFIMNTAENQKLFRQISPCIRRLLLIFDSLCPNIYRIHSSDSLRILNEIVCLAGEYLQVYPSMLISTNQLIFNEKYFNQYISKLRTSTYIPKTFSPLEPPELYCFGQGISAYNHNNELNQTTLFCFEVTMHDVSLPINILIHDPDEKLVAVDIKYINTYNQGYTTLFSCSYTPITRAGVYKISFYYNNVKITNHQYSVIVRNSISYEYFDQKKEQLLPEKVMQKGKHEVLFIFN